MAIIFGLLNRETEAVAAHLLAMSSATQIYALDGSYVRVDGRFGVGFQPFHTHPRSKLEFEPLLNHRGDIVVLDGGSTTTRNSRHSSESEVAIEQIQVS